MASQYSQKHDKITNFAELSITVSTDFTPYLIWSLDGLVQRMCKAKFLLYACAEMSS
jgi:hypothetical protein